MNLGMVPINLPPEPRLAVPAVVSDPFDAKHRRLSSRQPNCI